MFAGCADTSLGRLIRGDNMLEAYARYLTARSMSRKTIARYVGTAQRFADFVDGELERATTLDVEEFLLVQTNPKTRHAYRSDLHLFYRWAIRRCGFSVNPVDDTDPVRVGRPLPRPLSVDDVRAALSCGERRTRRCVGLGVFAGLRIGEIARLDGADVSLYHRELVVRGGKGDKDRVVPVHAELALLLDGIAARGPVIVGHHGGRVTADTVGDIIRRHFAALGIIGTPHQLRHVFGTEAARSAAGDLVTVAALMGHASMSTTMGYNGWTGKGRPVIDGMFGGAA